MSASPGIAADLPAPRPVDVIPRDVHFSTAASSGRDWLGGDVVGTAVFNALSLTFPEGERLFIDAVKAFRDQLPEPLASEARNFIVQEAIHTREHVALNKLLDRTHYPCDAIEAEIRKRTSQAREQGPMTMLGITIALEHFTAMMADWFLQNEDLLGKADPEVAELWRWHALEETEHKGVAFDVFLFATRDWDVKRRERVRNGLMRLITINFTRNIWRFAAKLLVADGMNPMVARAKVGWYLFGKPGLFRKSWAEYARWYNRDFHPWQHDNRHLLDKWRAHFEHRLPEAA